MDTYPKLLNMPPLFAHYTEAKVGGGGICPNLILSCAYAPPVVPYTIVMTAAANLDERQF